MTVKAERCHRESAFAAMFPGSMRDPNPACLDWLENGGDYLTAATRVAQAFAALEATLRTEIEGHKEARRILADDLIALAEGRPVTTALAQAVVATYEERISDACLDAAMGDDL